MRLKKNLWALKNLKLLKGRKTDDRCTCTLLKMSSAGKYFWAFWLFSSKAKINLKKVLVVLKDLKYKRGISIVCKFCYNILNCRKLFRQIGFKTNVRNRRLLEILVHYFIWHLNRNIIVFWCSPFSDIVFKVSNPLSRFFFLSQFV